MDELEINIEDARAWFACEERAGYSLVRVTAEAAASWADVLGMPVRRCYISDALLAQRGSQLGVTEREVIASALPDPGSTMSGDFGEILVLIYNCASELAHAPVSPKKWRLKHLLVHGDIRAGDPPAQRRIARAAVGHLNRRSTSRGWE